MSPASPRLQRIDLPRSGAQALLATERLIGGRAFGGLRVIPDLDEQELVAAARTMSLKYGFLGVAVGGAKAGLCLPHDATAGQRRAALHEMGGALGQEIASERWMPGIDMGIDLDDLRALFGGAGHRIDLTRWRNRSHEYTAWSVVAAIEAALAWRGRELGGATAAIEGFGRVGTALLHELASRGARVVAASTRFGAVVCPAGFDPERVRTLRQVAGDSFLLNYPGATAIDPRDLARQSVTVFVPAARAWSIDEPLAEQITALAVVPAANAALSRVVERRLWGRGVAVVPDFIANSGGVIGSLLEGYTRDVTLRQTVLEKTAERTRALLQRAAREAVAPIDLAESAAERWLDRAESGATRWPPAWRRALARRLPLLLRDPLARYMAIAPLYPIDSA